MTTVICSYDEQGLCGLRLSGHSGYAEEGSDIVCAAASVLFTACVNALETVTGIEPLVTMKPRQPLSAVQLPAGFPREKRGAANAVFQTAYEGLKATAEQYPDYLQIK